MISVIIPNYNHALFLKKRIDSVLNQTLQDFEIIILDDASDDNSMDIISSYKEHPKVTAIIVNKKNSGSPYLQWQKGFNTAKGDLIWIAESDDFSSPLFLETLTPLFNDIEIKIAFCRSMIVDEYNIEKGLDFWGKESNPEFWEQSFMIDGKRLLEKYQLYKNCLVNASSVIFRKSMLENISDYPHNLKRSGDWLFWNQIVMCGKVAYIADVLNYWRKHQKTTRAMGNYEVEKEKFHEQLAVISRTKKLIGKQIPIDYKKWSWIVEMWIRRFTYKNFFRRDYTFPPLPFRLMTLFYRMLFKRLFIALYYSVRNSFVKV